MDHNSQNCQDSEFASGLSYEQELKRIIFKQAIERGFYICIKYGIIGLAKKLIDSIFKFGLFRTIKKIKKHTKKELDKWIDDAFDKCLSDQWTKSVEKRIDRG